MYEADARDRLQVLSKVPIAETPFLNLNQLQYLDHNGSERTWYGVSRTNLTPAVEIAALTYDMKLILVTQFRPLVSRMTLELPAGLMDVPGESVIDVARRELLEEAGYAGGEATHILGDEDGFTVSCGLTDERLHLVLIDDVKKVAEPLDNEGTRPILVPLSSALDYLVAQRFGDVNINYQLFGTICLIQNYFKGAF